MKYRTIIELICEASSKDDAINIAGDYLSGDVEFGVQMKCRSVSLWAHKMKKYAASCAILFLVVSTLFLKISSMDDTGKICVLASGNSHGAYTVVPALKTKHEVDFKKEWDEKTDEVVMDFLKD